MLRPPKKIILSPDKKTLKVVFHTAESFDFPAEYLRVFSPSAEVQGHTPDQAVLQLHKENVHIIGIKPTGNYAITLEFDDGHHTGIYTWEALYSLYQNYEKNWQDYHAKRTQALARSPQQINLIKV